MHKIVCIVGESGSGKTTMAELLEKEGYKYIESFTTRKSRYEGERGHIFTTEKQYQCNKAQGTIVAETFFDGNYYWTTRGQFNGECIYVVDPIGVKDLKEKIKDIAIVVIYLKADEDKRYMRISERAREIMTSSEISSIEYIGMVGEINRRIEHDRKAFKIIQCDYCIDSNRPVEEVLKDTLDVIKQA